MDSNIHMYIYRERERDKQTNRQTDRLARNKIVIYDTQTHSRMGAQTRTRSHRCKPVCVCVLEKEEKRERERDEEESARPACCATFNSVSVHIGRLRVKGEVSIRVDGKRYRETMTDERAANGIMDSSAGS